MNRYAFTGLFLGVSLLKAQTAAAPAFEVASLRPHPVAGGIIIHVWTAGFQCAPRQGCGIHGNRFREVAVGLAELIIDAYKVKKFQIAGLPPWGDSGSDVYDLEAKLPGETPPTADQVRLMLQALLADRFQLKIHHETRQMSVYALVPDKKGIKLVPNKAPCLHVPEFDGHPARTRAKTDDPAPAWAFYAQALTISTHQPIVDETGLDGEGYCTPDGVDPLTALYFAMTDLGPSVFNAVEEKWGMRLESKKEPVDVIVVDKAERPSPN